MTFYSNLNHLGIVDEYVVRTSDRTEGVVASVATTYCLPEDFFRIIVTGSVTETENVTVQLGLRHPVGQLRPIGPKLTVANTFQVSGTYRLGGTWPTWGVAEIVVYMTAPTAVMRTLHVWVTADIYRRNNVSEEGP